MPKGYSKIGYFRKKPNRKKESYYKTGNCDLCKIPRTKNKLCENCFDKMVFGDKVMNAIQENLI